MKVKDLTVKQCLHLVGKRIYGLKYSENDCSIILGTVKAIHLHEKAEIIFKHGDKITEFEENHMYAKIARLEFIEKKLKETRDKIIELQNEDT
jgi:hypothetical protein